MRIIVPNKAGDWINQRHSSFFDLIPLFKEKEQPGNFNPIFSIKTRGILTSKDAWYYNWSKEKLESNIHQFIRKTTHQTKKDEIRISLYRPYIKQRLYYNNKKDTKFSQILPSPNTKNISIAIMHKTSRNSFYTLATDCIADRHLTEDSTFYPQWRYISTQALKKDSSLEKISNIEAKSHIDFIQYYAEPNITKNDIFYYIYGILHSEQWRNTFKDDLTKFSTRIPMADSKESFYKFADAGKKLVYLHINYEDADPYPLDEIYSNDWNPNLPDAFHIEKMAYEGSYHYPNKRRIIYNPNIVLANIPNKSHEYKLGFRSAIDWIVHHYRIKTDEDNNIVNNPNDWTIETGNSRYIIDLIKKVTTVSIHTVDIINNLPELNL